MVNKIGNSNNFNQDLKNLETIELFEGDDTQNSTKESDKENSDGKETFTWPEKAFHALLRITSRKRT